MSTEMEEIHLTYPTTEGWTPLDLIRDVLDLKKAAQQQKLYGPYFLDLAQAWRPYLDAVYAPLVNPKTTLMDRLFVIEHMQLIVTTNNHQTKWGICLYSLAAVGT